MKTKTLIRFKKLKDGYILDTTTGLEWGQSSEVRMDFKSAVEYCKQKGGRLPTRRELEDIQDLNKYNPCADSNLNMKSDYYWTGQKCAFGEYYWCVSFGNGFVFLSIEGTSNYVRPVRSSQC